MRKRSVMLFVVFSMFLVLFSSPANAADWRFPVGFTYVSGFSDVVDIYEDNLRAEGYTVDTSYGSPIGLAFNPYVQFENGFGIGAGIGPAMLIISNVSSDLFALPVGLDLRYTLIPDGNISPYIRAGGRYYIVDGEYVEGSTPGFFGGIGVEFLRKKVIGFGTEVSYDSSKIELKRVRTNSTEKVQPGKFMASIFAVF